jgi:hypothetical protein
MHANHEARRQLRKRQTMSNINTRDIKDKAEKEWLASAAIRAEFGENKAAFVAYSVANVTGKIKVMNAGNGIYSATKQSN